MSQYVTHLMRDRANFRQQHWVNIYATSTCIFARKVFSKKREARRAAKLNPPSYLINIKPKRRS